MGFASHRLYLEASINERRAFCTLCSRQFAQVSYSELFGLG